MVKKSIVETKEFSVPTFKTYGAKLKETWQPMKRGGLVGVGEVIGELATGSKSVGTMTSILTIPFLKDDKAREILAVVKGNEIIRELIME